MTAKTKEDIEGYEYDWIACDADGHVALFSTGGSGYAPVAFLRDIDAHDAAIDRIIAMPASTQALKCPDLGPEYANTWRDVAVRGLFAFDCDSSKGAYKRVAVPLSPAYLHDFDHSVVETAKQICLGNIRFSDVEFLTQDVVELGITDVRRNP